MEMAREEGNKVKLLGLWVSPFVRRVEWALKLKGVTYDYVEEDILNKSPLLLELNPVHKRVPVMVHDGKVICESFVILEYIDETWKHRPLLPQDPHDRATARFWARLVEEKLLENAWTVANSEGEEKERAQKIVVEVLERIEEYLEGKRFFSGDDLGFLDLAVGWVSYWLPVWQEVGSAKIIDPLRFPRTISWSGSFLAHPLIRDNLPPRDKMLEYFQQKRERIMASRARGSD